MMRSQLKCKPYENAARVFLTWTILQVGRIVTLISLVGVSEGRILPPNEGVYTTHAPTLC